MRCDDAANRMVVFGSVVRHASYFQLCKYCVKCTQYDNRSRTTKWFGVELSIGICVWWRRAGNDDACDHECVCVDLFGIYHKLYGARGPGGNKI